MRKSIYTIIALLITGCGRSYDVRGFEQYVDKFNSIAEQQHSPVRANSRLVIRFGTTNATEEEAHCHTGMLETPTIIVGPSWRTLTDQSRELLMLHELGHCVLNRDHKMDKDENGNAVSIMYPNLAWLENAYANHPDEYQRELFQR